MRSHHPLRIKAYKEIARARNNVILEPVTNFRCVDCEMGAQLRVMIQAEIKNKIKEFPERFKVSPDHSDK